MSAPTTDTETHRGSAQIDALRALARFKVVAQRLADRRAQKRLKSVAPGRYPPASIGALCDTVISAEREQEKYDGRI